MNVNYDVSAEQHRIICTFQTHNNAKQNKRINNIIYLKTSRRERKARFFYVCCSFSTRSCHMRCVIQIYHDSGFIFATRLLRGLYRFYSAWRFLVLCAVICNKASKKDSHFGMTHVIHMSHFAYACKMRCPLNLVLENSEYPWFY